MTYPTKTFNLSALNGLSEKQIRVHLALYEGYVKNVNLILGNPAAGRFAFEFDGMRMHEYYFAQFEGGSIPPHADRQDLITNIKEVAMTRGTGWVVAYFDTNAKIIHTVFVNDHELGQLAGLPILLALDLWEHAYMVDYIPAEKKNYVDAFFANLNWSVVEKRFEDAMKMSIA
jgi:Fe-Mn family superoxide dismutase